ncbi:3-keto-5-aminohexanoate cleavage protein [Bosea lupini]|nr:3-keto-5-aminohexanoate cleavage protein [Bosea lupini]
MYWRSRYRPRYCGQGGRTRRGTLDLNTMFSGTAVVINTPRNVTEMARRIYAAGVLPELELFDGGDLQLAKALQADGVLRNPLLIQIVLGVRYGAIPNPQTLVYFASQLPPDCIWAAFGIGRHEVPLLAQAFLLGGHVRVGLEDNVYIRKGVLARDNAELVEKAGTIIENLGGALATPAEARTILGL